MWRRVRVHGSKSRWSRDGDTQPRPSYLVEECQLQNRLLLKSGCVAQSGDLCYLAQDRCSYMLGKSCGTQDVILDAPALPAAMKTLKSAT